MNSGNFAGSAELRSVKDERNVLNAIESHEDTPQQGFWLIHLIAIFIVTTVSKHVRVNSWDVQARRMPRWKVCCSQQIILTSVCHYSLRVEYMSHHHLVVSCKPTCRDNTNRIPDMCSGNTALKKKESLTCFFFIGLLSLCGSRRVFLLCSFCWKQDIFNCGSNVFIFTVIIGNTKKKNSFQKMWSFLP